MHMTKTPTKAFISKIACWLAVFTCMAAIFSFSSQGGTQSNSISKGIVEEVKAYVSVPAILKNSILLQNANSNTLIRKFAHFSEFFILALFLYMALRLTRVGANLSCMITLLICILYADLDEYHQFFVPDRSPVFKDVVIDSLGAASALLIVISYRIAKYIKMSFIKRM